MHRRRLRLRKRIRKLLKSRSSRRNWIKPALVAVTIIFSGVVITGTAIYGEYRANQIRSAQQEQVQSELQETAIIRPKVSVKAKQGFANLFDRLDMALPKKYQITPSLEIAQGALESGWGQSTLYKEGNNPFGVKGSYNGDYLSYYSPEYKNDRREIDMSNFRQYPNLEEAVKDHNILLKKQFLQGSHGDYVSEAKALQNNGYATDPDYAKKLMNYVQRNNLTRFD